MNSIGDARARLARLDRPAGPAARALTLGFATIRFEGLESAAAAVLDARWDGFAAERADEAPALTVRTVESDGGVWLPAWAPGEGYRIEADAAGGALVVRSYHFALTREGPGAWRLAVTDTGAEPIGRVYDNATRYLVARLAIERGGVALHGAGIRRGGRGWIFAGPSGSGKSTAARLSAPAESLGDDFAVVLPHGNGWATCALPFDNAERAPEPPVEGLVELALVCRLFKAPQHRLERPEGAFAPASLLACSAFPWAFPDLAEPSGDAIARLAASGRFVHLHLAQDAGFWELLERTD